MKYEFEMESDVEYLELRPEHSDFGEKMIMEPLQDTQGYRGGEDETTIWCSFHLEVEIIERPIFSQVNLKHDALLH